MNKTLVAYFSASGVTAKLAKDLAAAIGADTFEIVPEVPYTEADLDWHDKTSRSSVEMEDVNSRPEIASKCDNMSDYNNVFLGFPIWWYQAPTIINTFLEAYDMTGKKLITFATSGSSELDKTNEKLADSCKGATLLEGKVIRGEVSADELREFAGQFVDLTVEDESSIEIEPLFEEQVDFDTFSKSDFRVVKVKECTAVKKSKKLLHFILDDGTGIDRIILSGVHAFYEPEELVGKTLLAIVNLPPRSMMGIESCGMLLSAIHQENGEEKLNLVMLNDAIPAGAKIY